jgi:hypothetical protein
MSWGRRWLTTLAEGNKVVEGRLTNKQQPTINMSGTMMENDGAGSKQQERWRAMECDSRQQINNQPLMGVAKVDRDTAVKAKTAPVVNGVFRHSVDYGGGRKVGADGRVAVDNRQQCQWQSGNNQLKVMVARGGIDSRGGGDKQRWSTAIDGNWQQDANGQGDHSHASYLLVVVVGSWRRAGGGSGSQVVKESGPNISSCRCESILMLSPHPK